MLDNYYENISISQNESKAFLRLLHASPNAPAVDVYANNKKIAENLKYKDFTPYLELKPDKYNIKVYPAGRQNNSVINTEVNIKPGIATAAAIGMLKDISLLIIPEPVIPLPSGRLGLRLVHLSPDAPAVDLYTEDGKMLFEEITYKSYTPYIPLPPGVHSFRVKISGTDKTVLKVPNQRLHPDRFYSFYVIGLATGSPGLQALTPLDGNSYLRL